MSGSSGGFENRADDMMGTDGERTLTLEFLRNTSAQRAVDSNLFVRSFLHAVSNSTLGPCVLGTEVAVGLGVEIDEPISMRSDMNPTDTCATSSAIFNRGQPCHSVWFIVLVSPYNCEGPVKNPSIWKESLTWIVPRIRLVRGGNLEG